MTREKKAKVFAVICMLFTGRAGEYTFTSRVMVHLFAGDLQLLYCSLYQFENEPGCCVSASVQLKADAFAVFGYINSVIIAIKGNFLITVVKS